MEYFLYILCGACEFGEFNRLRKVICEVKLSKEEFDKIPGESSFNSNHNCYNKLVVTSPNHGLVCSTCKQEKDDNKQNKK